MIDPQQSHDDREREADKRHRCRVCGDWGVIPSLARQCEARHARATVDLNYKYGTVSAAREAT